jgi:hypothetical protein
MVESIITRTIGKTEQAKEYTRPVGLSATLSNYKNIVFSLCVNEKKGLFHLMFSYHLCAFDNNLLMSWTKKAVKRYQIAHGVCYEKVID